MTSLHRSFRKLNLVVILNIVGYLLIAEGGFMLFPLLCALFYKEWECAKIFLFSALLCVAIGFILSRLNSKKKSYFARDGLFAVGLGWIVISIFGGLPFYWTQEIPSFTDCFFETVSGFTTTGATILTDIESLSRSTLFWRSLTHWLGGMGILVFVLAFLPKSNERSMHLMRAEAPGPSISKLVPRMKTTATILYLLYFGLSVLELIFLLAGGMSFYESLIHTFGTAGTGGFSVLATSIGQYNNAYYEAVITIFMLLFGINFNLYFFLLIKDFKSVYKNQELHAYLGIIAVSTAAIMVNIHSMYGTWLQAFRYASFQVVSVITTTGYATADFNLWPMFSKAILLLLMVSGAMAGSTGGGVKVTRLMIVVRQIRLNIQKLVHPQKTKAIMMDDKIVDSEIVSQTMGFFSCWMVLIGVGILFLALDNFDFETTVSAAFTCIGNVGPGFGLCGPMGGFSMFSNLSKIVLSFLMLIGRLEIYPILIFIFPLTHLASDLKPHKIRRFD
jgi:trk system potassium uptake protein TrkH